MIVDLAASWNGSRIARAAGNDDRQVEVWDLETLQVVARFLTVRQAGGSRLAISLDGSAVLAAAYDRYGVALYDVDTGQSRWHRRDITAIQETAFARYGDQVFCVSDKGPTYVLACIDGKTVREFPRVRWACESPLGRFCVFFDGQRYGYLDDPTAVILPAKSQGEPIAGAFSKDLLCLAEVRGPLRFFDCGTSLEVARLIAPADCHWIRVTYDSDAEQFAAVLYNFERAQTVLQRFNRTASAMEDICELDSSTYIFCQRGGRVLGPSGDLRQTDTGNLVGQFHW